MKIILFLIILFTIISKSNSQWGITVVQMTPYGTDSTCTSGEEKGVGYNFLTDTCFSLTTEAYGNTYFNVETTSDLTSATISQYKSNDKKCSNAISDTIKTFTNNTCVQVPNYTNKNELSIENSYVLVTITNNPMIPNLYGLKSSVYGDPACESYPYFYYYVINGTVFNSNNNGGDSLIYCNGDIPFEETCSSSSNNKCETSKLSTGCSRDYSHFFEDLYIWNTC